MKSNKGVLAKALGMTFSAFGLASTCMASDGEQVQHHNEHHQSAAELAKHLEVADRDHWQKPEKIISLLGQSQGKTILDIGAGTGYFSFRLVDAGAKVIAADADPEFLAMIQAKKHKLGLSQSQLETRQIPFDSPGIAPAEVDAVLIVDTYHHINNRIDYFTKVKQGIKPNGKLVVVDYKKYSAIDSGPPLSMRLEPEVVKRELESAGFSDISINTELLSRQYIIQAYVESNSSETNRMKDFWDEEYSKETYLFGTEPDGYFAKVLPKFKPGRLLLPGEGEGRNAVFAAKLGWDVTAYDYSAPAKAKADKLAKAHNVSIQYDTKNILKADYPDASFDAIAFLYIHFGLEDRKIIHQLLDKQLKQGGILILETFSTEHPKYNTSGPQSAEFLYSEKDIQRDFPNYEILEMKVDREYLKEGPSEMGESAVFRFIGKKK